MINYYFSPGNIYNLYNFGEKNNINLKETNLISFLKTIIKNNFFKKELFLRYIFYDYIELCLKNTSKRFKNGYYNYFIKRIYELKTFNLDEESFFIEFRIKYLMDKNFYITTPIYYPSAKPHMGHAYSSIIADFFARLKIDGFDVHFLTGTDEHGLKIQKAAEQKNVDTLEIL